jgi:hypothetical protein
MENLNTRIFNKKAQMTIWAIVALLLMAGIVIVYLLARPVIPNAPENSDPKPLITSCIKDAVSEAQNLMLPQGGFTYPDNYRIYNGSKVSYLCKYNGYFHPCIQQHPMYLDELGGEFKRYISPKIENCFSELKTRYESEKYTVQIKEMNLSVHLGPGKIYVDLIRPITFEKRGAAFSLADFSLSVNSPLYDLASVATEISTQEAKYCYFEYVGYMILYPQFDIRKITMSEGTRIYTIKDTSTKKELNIAIRGCVIVPGI